MKITLLLSILVFAAPFLAAENFIFILDQRNIEGDGFVRSIVAQEDSMTSPLPIPEGGSDFDLWAVNSPSINELLNGSVEPLWTHIGNEFVSAYLPQGQLAIVTNDPYSGGLPRTRVDEPFTLTTTVSGLKPNDEEAPDAAKTVLFNHEASVTPFTEEVLKPDPTATPELVSQGTITNNGSESESRLPILPVDYAFSAGAIETFTLHALPDNENVGMVLSTAKVEVWPLADATFAGIKDGAKYSQIPPFTITLTKLYPDSFTYLQIYPGGAAPGTVGTKIPGDYPHSDTKTIDKILTFAQLQNNVTQDGTYTIEVITETPFGKDIVGTPLTFEYYNTIKARGSFNTLR